LNSFFTLYWRTLGEQLSEKIMESDKKALMAKIYAAFNKRDIDGTLAFMSENVDWPKSSEGGRVVGKKDIRAYWTRQWTEFNPHVEPIEVIVREDDKTDVKVHQLVKSLDGEVLSDQDVWHIYTIKNGLIERMDISEKEPSFSRNQTFKLKLT
jgi:hypothetical protein